METNGPIRQLLSEKDGKNYWCMSCRRAYNTGRYEPILAAAKRLLNQKRIKSRRKAKSARKRGLILPSPGRCTVKGCKETKLLVMHHYAGHTKGHELDIVDVCRKHDYGFHNEYFSLDIIDWDFIQKEKEKYEKTNTN